MYYYKLSCIYSGKISVFLLCSEIAKGLESDELRALVISLTSSHSCCIVGDCSKIGRILLMSIFWKSVTVSDPLGSRHFNFFESLHTNQLKVICKSSYRTFSNPTMCLHLVWSNLSLCKFSMASCRLSSKIRLMRLSDVEEMSALCLWWRGRVVFLGKGVPVCDLFDSSCNFGWIRGTPCCLHIYRTGGIFTICMDMLI